MNSVPVAIEETSPRTYCNPLNLDYLVQNFGPCRREAADPAALLFNGDYYIFASKSNGYWWSTDFDHWTLVTPPNLPLIAYAPAIFEYDGALYFMASGPGRLYRSTAPRDANSWTDVGEVRRDTDPDLFRDDDGRVYLYYGCAPDGPISGVELDPKNSFREVGRPVDLIRSNLRDHGWEQGGEDNSGTVCWIEAPWMTKHDGHYYLQYSAPGTEWKTYGDGVYVSDKPLGPFTYADYSPFSYKPTGFMGGAGHSTTFQDKEGHWWRICTGTISVLEKFERRLALFPAGFDREGRFFTRTALADLPQFLPGRNPHPETDNSPGWMLLTYHKPIKASSSLEGHPAENAFDEDIRTWWSAASKEPGESLQVDLGEGRIVNAIQVNFAEQDMTARGRTQSLAQRYRIESSDDGSTWRAFIDKSGNIRDVPHDYIELAKPARIRFLRIVDIATPGGGRFSLRGLRVFGTAEVERPAKVEGLKVERNPQDRRRASLSWQAAKGAEGYIIRYGVVPGGLYNQYEVRDTTELSIASLNAPVTYLFTNEAFNESGTAAPASAIKVP